MMIGGDKDAFEHLDPIFAALAPGVGSIERRRARAGRDPRVEQGYLYCGPAGSGHFVKMVHNGIEYGVMQAYAEGFDILKNVNTSAVPENRRYQLNLPDIAEVWRRGSVVASWLLDLTAICAGGRTSTLSRPSPALSKIPARGAGRSTRRSSRRCRPMCCPPRSYTRFRSRQSHTFAEKILSAMRNEFGGHQEPPKGKAHEPCAGTRARPGWARAQGAALRDGDFYGTSWRPDEAPVADARRSYNLAKARPAIRHFRADRHRPLRAVSTMQQFRDESGRGGPASFRLGHRRWRIRGRIRRRAVRRR